MELLIDDTIIGTVFVNTTTPEIYTFDVSIEAGPHKVAIGFSNDFYEPFKFLDRNLYVDKTRISYCSPCNTISTIDAEEDMSHDNGGVFGDYWSLWSNGMMSEENVDFPVTATYHFEVLAKGDLVNGVGPEMELLIDDTIIGTVFVNTTTPGIFTFEVPIEAGLHKVAIGFSNDFWNPLKGLDRNLYVDKIILTQCD
jgi:hypothetical protein